MPVVPQVESPLQDLTLKQKPGPVSFMLLFLSLAPRPAPARILLPPLPLPFCSHAVIDVGGQPGQRKKWSSAVPPDTELSSAFFFVAADEYDVPSEENPQKTKIEISLSTPIGISKLPSIVYS